jgi:hypothetical protein
MSSDRGLAALAVAHRLGSSVASSEESASLLGRLVDCFLCNTAIEHRSETDTRYMNEEGVYRSVPRRSRNRSAGICAIRHFRNSEIRRERLFARYQQKIPTKRTAPLCGRELLRVFSIRRENFRKKIRNRTMALNHCYC